MFLVSAFFRCLMLKYITYEFCVKTTNLKKNLNFFSDLWSRVIRITIPATRTGSETRTRQQTQPNAMIPGFSDLPSLLRYPDSKGMVAYSLVAHLIGKLRRKNFLRLRNVFHFFHIYQEATLTFQELTELVLHLLLDCFFFQ